MTALMVRIRQEHQSIAEKVAQLSKETNEFLSATTAKRQVNAKQQAEELLAFHIELQETSQQFLAQTAEERIAQAEKQYGMPIAQIRQKYRNVPLDQLVKKESLYKKLLKALRG